MVRLFVYIQFNKDRSEIRVNRDSLVEDMPSVYNCDTPPLFGLSGKEAPWLIGKTPKMGEKLLILP